VGSCVVMGAMASSAMVLAQQGPDAPAESPPLPAPEPTPTEPATATEDVKAPAEPTAEPELTEEELKLLQESIAADQADVSTSPPQSPGPSAAAAASFLDVAVILDAAAAYFTGEPLQAGGHDPAQTGFTLQQLELSLGANVDPFLRFDANLVFTFEGVEVEEAYATTLDLPASLQARAGQLLTRFGRTNVLHPHAWHFVDQPLANGKFLGGDGSRGLGVEASWLAPLPWYVEVLGSATTAEAECCARSFTDGQGGIASPADLIATTALKQFFELSADLSLAFGLSGQFGRNPTGPGHRTELYGTDVYLRYRPLDSTTRSAVSLTAEAMVRRREVPGRALSDLGVNSELVFTFTPQWEAGARYGLVTGVEEDYLDPEQDKKHQRADLQLTYYPSHFSRLRLQGGWDGPDFRSAPIWKGMIAFEVVTGAHGAHGY